MSDIRIEKISDAVTLKSFTDPRFKTMKISVNMLVPMARRTAAAYGILPSLVSRATREYPNFTALNARLSELYGTDLSSGVRKLGGYQVLSVSAGGIASRYAFDGEDMFAELSKLLFSVLFAPLKDQDGLFPLDNFEQERRQILEMKDSEFNDKITYAHQRCEQILFEGLDAGMDRHGSREDVAALDRGELSQAWEDVISGAKFEIFALGDCHPDPELFRRQFAGVGKARSLDFLSYEEPQEVRRVVEEQPLSQSKLSMAFRADLQPEEWLVFQLMNAVLGGTPSSKFFQNVREKMGLCYYCSSSLNALSRALYVESGVETENIEKAEAEILNQIRLLQEGEVTEEELLSAKLALCNAFRSVGDSLHAVENWYLTRGFAGGTASPEQAADQIMAYTAGDVVRAAQKLRLGAVYSLKGRDNG